MAGLEAHLSNDEFFTQLAEKLFANTSKKDHGSVNLTQKRLTYGTEVPSTDATSTTFSDLEPPAPLSLIIRATNGKSTQERDGKSKSEREAAKIKLSTIVAADSLDAFFARYADVCKAGMSGLKKRDRSKGKQKLKAKKKKLGAGEEVKKA